MFPGRKEVVASSLGDLLWHLVMCCRSFLESPCSPREGPGGRGRYHPSSQEGNVLKAVSAAQSQGGVALPCIAMVEKGFASFSVAVSKSGIENSTTSRAQVELKAWSASAFQSLLDGAWLIRESDRNCWVVTSWGERGQKNIPERKGYNSSLLVVNL